jgi:hypothetical protein
MLLPLFPLPVPAVVLLGLVVVPVAVMGLLAVLIGMISRRHIWLSGRCGGRRSRLIEHDNEFPDSPRDREPPTG